MVKKLILFFKWEVVVLKLEDKGMTLVETLFAFIVYVNIIVLLLSLYNQMILNTEKISTNIQKIEDKEVIVLQECSLEDVIKMVLH